MGAGKVCGYVIVIIEYNYRMIIHMYLHSSPQSTLLQCLLKELPALSGGVTVRGSVAYASQESWLLSVTLRENILFGLPYYPDWYNTVVEACALEKVILNLMFDSFYNN